MKFQRGQSIVEFALVLPLFLLLVAGIVYVGFALSDYLTLSSTTRSIAHEASLTRNENNRREIVKRQIRNVDLRSGLFIWNPDSNGGSNNNYLRVTTDDANNSVVVRSHADYNPASFVGRLMSGFGSNTDLKDGLNIQYIMYCPSEDD